MKQYAKNACGSIAVYHAILNNLNLDIVSKDSPIDKFYQSSKDLSMVEKGELFKNDKSLKEKHKKGVSNEKCSSEVVEEVETHFVCFVKKDG